MSQSVLVQLCTPWSWPSITNIILWTSSTAFWSLCARNFCYFLLFPLRVCHCPMNRKRRRVTHVWATEATISRFFLRKLQQATCFLSWGVPEIHSQTLSASCAESLPFSLRKDVARTAKWNTTGRQDLAHLAQHIECTRAELVHWLYIRISHTARQVLNTWEPAVRMATWHRHRHQRNSVCRKQYTWPSQRRTGCIKPMSVIWMQWCVFFSMRTCLLHFLQIRFLLVCVCACGGSLTFTAKRQRSWS